MVQNVGWSSASLPWAALSRSSKSSASALLLAAPFLVPLALSSLDMNRTHCDDSSTGEIEEETVTLAVLSVPDADTANTADDTSEALPNPLWPSGVSVDMVNQYVDQLLADPDINIKGVPDSIERSIYVSTVRLTLNLVYEVVSWLHGTELLGHLFVLERIPAKHEDVVALDFRHNFGKVNVPVLEAMADELLKNKTINQRWLPDVIERQVYVNSMRIIFTIIDSIADTMVFQLCGHSLSLRFEPINPDVARKLIKNYKHESIRLDDKKLDEICDQAMKDSIEASSSVDKLSYLPGYHSFMRTLHRTLCKLCCACVVSNAMMHSNARSAFNTDSLILGILDDILSKAELLILDDRVRISLIPQSQFVVTVARAESDSKVDQGGAETSAWS